MIIPGISRSPPDSRPVDNHRDSESVGSKSPPNPVGKDSPCTTRDLGGIRDTELAKHYLTHTAQTFARGGMSDMWRILIPAVALTCPVVRRGMLTLAAICLHYESSLDHSDEHRSEYLDAAEAHGKIFVKESRQKMQDFQEGLRTQDQDSILACSRLLCVLGFAFFRTHRQNGPMVSNPSAWTWLHLLRGVKTSYDAVVDAGRPVDEMFMKDMTPQICYSQPIPRMDVGCPEPSFRYIQQSRRAFIDALRSALYSDWSSLGELKTADLGAAIDVLDQVTEQVCSQQPQNLLRTICRWSADISKGFVDLLIGRSPPALVVYAHWLMLMVLVEDIWFIDDMGRAGIREIIGTCSDVDRVTHSLLFWPQHMLRLCRESADTSS